MKALVLADIHGDVSALLKLKRHIIENGRGIDYVFLLGDYSKGFKDAGENRADIVHVLEILSDFKVKAIPGNCDQRESVEIFEQNGVNFHKAHMRVGDVDFIGYGGSNPTPFDTPFELSEDEILNDLSFLMDKVGEGNKSVLLVHFPPYNTLCDEIGDGKHVGSASLRQVIEEKKPDLVLCSHIHECGGKTDTVGETVVYNIGRITQGYAYLLDMDTLELKTYS